MIEIKHILSETLRIILYVTLVFLTIYFLVWLFYDGGISKITSKTNEAVSGQPFDKNGEDVKSYLAEGDDDCWLQCSWETKSQDPVYIYEPSNNSRSGRCYCKH